jgi:hypothetical protein
MNLVPTHSLLSTLYPMDHEFDQVRKTFDTFYPIILYQHWKDKYIGSLSKVDRTLYQLLSSKKIFTFQHHIHFVKGSFRFCFYLHLCMNIALLTITLFFFLVSVGRVVFARRIYGNILSFKYYHAYNVVQISFFSL